jgi:hypothetical protein
MKVTQVSNQATILALSTAPRELKVKRAKEEKDLKEMVREETIKNKEEKESQEIMEPNSEKKRRLIAIMMISKLSETPRKELKKHMLLTLIAMKKTTHSEEEVDSEVPEFLEVEKEVVATEEEVDFSRILLKEPSELRIQKLHNFNELLDKP